MTSEPQMSDKGTKKSRSNQSRPWSKGVVETVKPIISRVVRGSRKIAVWENYKDTGSSHGRVGRGRNLIRSRI